MSRARRSSPASGVPSGRPLPSARALALEAMAAGALEVVFQRGVRPDLEQLVGWEFRGINTPRWARLLGVKKFIKGFFRESGRGDDGELYGYNCPVVQNRLDEPWIAKPDDAAPKRFGFFHVGAVDPTARDNEYLHAALLDYGRGGNATWDPSRGLRDYLIQVDADDRDLYLGKAYYAIGPARVATSFFVLERYRPGPAQPR